MRVGTSRRDLTPSDKASSSDQSLVKLWLDDVRAPPAKDWTWVNTVDAATVLLETGRIVEASLDHDLGEGTPEGYELCLWMAEHDIWPRDAIAVHSANPVGAARMCGVIERYGPFRRVPGSWRFERP